MYIKLRGTTQIAKDNVSPAAFGALTLRSVRFTFAGSSGVARNDPDRSTLQPWALSLDGGVCISDPIIAICHNFTFRKADTTPLCVQSNYSIRKTFVNGFSTKTALYLKQGYGTQMRRTSCTLPPCTTSVVL